MRQDVIRITTFAYTFVVSYSLVFASAPYLGSLPEAAKQRASYDAATPVEFLALSRSFDAEMARGSLATPKAFADEPTIEPDPAFGLHAISPTKPALTSRDLPAVSTATAPALASVTGLAAAAVTTPATSVPMPAMSATTPAATLEPKLDTRQAVVEPPPSAAAPIQDMAGLSPNVDRISFDTPALAPLAFMRFCLHYADDCKFTEVADRSEPVELTEVRRAELVQINREVNRAISPQANLGGLMAEEWLVSPAEGDCNDYAVTKRHELLALGWPSRALLLAEVVVPSGEHHLVLVVRTRQDDLVLDNLNWNIRSVSQIRYRWVRIEQANNPKFWSTASVTRSARVALNNRMEHDLHGS